MTKRQYTGTIDVDIHVERLVIDGIALTTEERPQLKTAIERELQALYVGRRPGPALRVSRMVASVPAPSIDSSDSNARQLGKRIARSVHEGIER